ncbi:hypothetical protein RhiXN_04566 [Rhizoctonia solani]|uniref:Uncharacterized protein n=1 Tax=Rhizoctonia solani TaxID=456999 RepID=A0A8H8NNS3_9AGAM|nr:uncharacterized protein RhiXN_04566 [Rhizoctonia solani]QRW16565.1 hypothetical protein RhiXN_04566 [Rhizoctonia solani]
MRECWNINPVHRPRADEVEQRLREAILLEHSHQFGGPMFDSQLPDETRPSVIGDEEDEREEAQGGNPNEARTTLVAAALGYHCHGHRDDAHTIQIQIGWILIDQQQFQAAQAHFEAVRGVANGDLIVACKRGLARTAVGFGNFDEATMQYGSALALCREGRFTDYEYMIIRETANAILGHPKNQGSPEENLRSRNMARELFKEALSLSMDPSVRTSNTRFEFATGQQNIAEEVYNYLLDSEVLSEAQYSAFYMELLELRPNNAHTSHGEIDSTSSSWVLHQP